MRAIAFLVAFDKNAAELARKLPIAPDFKLLAGAGHFVFLAPAMKSKPTRAGMQTADQ